MPPIEIRVLDPDDWGLWRRLRLSALAQAPEAFGSTLADWTGAGDREARWRSRLSTVALNLVASIGDEAVGMASATAPESDEVELISMWVAPVARRRGVGSTLIEVIAGWAGDQGVSQVALDVRSDNLTAIWLYQRCGFVDAGQSPNSEPGAPERRMVRPVNLIKPPA